MLLQTILHLHQVNETFVILFFGKMRTMRTVLGPIILSCSFSLVMGYPYMNPVDLTIGFVRQSHDLPAKLSQGTFTLKWLKQQLVDFQIATYPQMPEGDYPKIRQKMFFRHHGQETSDIVFKGDQPAIVELVEKRPRHNTFWDYLDSILAQNRKVRQVVRGPIHYDRYVLSVTLLSEIDSMVKNASEEDLKDLDSPLQEAMHRSTKYEKVPTTDPDQTAVVVWIKTPWQELLPETQEIQDTGDVEMTDLS